MGREVSSWEDSVTKDDLAIFGLQIDPSKLSSKLKGFQAGQTCLLKIWATGDTILIWAKLVEFGIKVFQRYSNEAWPTLLPERKCLVSKGSSSRGRTQQLGRTTKY